VTPQESHDEKYEIKGHTQEMAMMAKNLITIQMNFVPNPSKMWIRQQFT